eukprot:14492355-Ditylum_brightwellii.AAC.1
MTCISNYPDLKCYSVCGVVVHGCGTYGECRFDDAIWAVGEGLITSSARCIGDDTIGGNWGETENHVEGDKEVALI